MSSINKHSFYFAMLAFLFALTVYVISFGGYSILEVIPITWVLHLGLLLVLILVIIKIINVQMQHKSGSYNRGIRNAQFSIFVFLFKNTPILLAIVAVMSFATGFITIAYVMLKDPEAFVLSTNQVELPVIQGIQYVDAEQRLQECKILASRNIAGIWLTVYSLAMAVLYQKGDVSSKAYK